MRLKDTLQIIVVLLLLQFSSIARPILIVLASMSLSRSLVFRVPQFDGSKLQDIAEYLYGIYDIVAPVIIQISNSVSDMYPDTVTVMGKTVGGAHSVYINTTRTILGRIFPLYKDAIILFYLLLDIKNQRLTQVSMYRTIEPKNDKNFLYDAVIQNFGVLFGYMDK